MEPDTGRLREQLAEQLRAQWRLDAVECAEQVVRAHQHQLLADELTILDQDLSRAQRCLSSARAGRDLSFIVIAEEHVREIQRRATIVQRQSREHEHASFHSDAAYLSTRRQLLDRISGLQRLILRAADPSA